MGVARAMVQRVSLFGSSDVKDENSGLRGSACPGICLIIGLLVWWLLPFL